LAGFRDRYPNYVERGVEVAGLSTDTPGEAAVLHEELSLPFPLLCDQERRVVTAWGRLNPGERGGIAVPTVVVLDPDRRVRYLSDEGHVSRVTAGELLQDLDAGRSSASRRTYMLPTPRETWIAIRNFVGLGPREPR